MIFSYFRNTRGNVAIMFALIVTVLIGCGAAAVDMSSLRSKTSKLQSLADAAVLAAAGSDNTDNLAKLTRIAKKFVNENNMTGEKVKTEVRMTDDGHIQVFVDHKHKTFMMGIFGKKYVPIEVVAEAPIAATDPANIVLVLDTTGSMTGAKLKTLKKAAKSLVKSMNEFENENVRISVIPFAQYVNVGKSRRNKVWLDVPTDSAEKGEEVCRMTADVISRTNCRKIKQTCTNDGVSYPCTKTKCDVKYGPKYEKCFIPTKKSTWHGCVGSRNNPYNERAAFDGQKIPGLMNVNCATEIQPLTNDFSQATATINGLKAYGYTYIPSGLIWGWRALQPDLPLAQSKVTMKHNPRNIMILMTDGANTVSANGNMHDGDNVAHANKLTKTLCKSINDEGIEMYTVAYEVNDANIKNILKKCATHSDNYFDARNAKDLQNAFDSISKSLLKLRLTH